MVGPILGHPDPINPARGPVGSFAASTASAVAGSCLTGGHVYGGPGGWRVCACDRGLPAHVDTPPDPAGGPGCGMVWRVCADCAHVDEHHITDHDTEHDTEYDTEYDAEDADGVLDLPPWWPEVVTLCGSMRFLPQMLQVAAELTARRVIVLAPFVAVSPGPGWGTGREFKAMLDELHRRKIDMSSRVVVVSDASGYYGESTRNEIDYAAALGRPVEFRRIRTNPPAPAPPAPVPIAPAPAAPVVPAVVVPAAVVFRVGGGRR